MVKRNCMIFLYLVIFSIILCYANGEEKMTKSADKKTSDTFIYGVHLFAPWHNEMSIFKRTISEVLAPMGINTIVIEVNYKLAFDSHPELREPGPNLTKEDAREIAEICKKNKIKLVPLFNCLGHQSWAQNNFPLILKYPQFDETPDISLENKKIYCRSWCPSHPEVNKIIFSLFDEIIDAFQADSFHVGMDEVFLIAHDKCPRCNGKDPAKLFAMAVNDYYKHIVEEKKLTMFMWGDRLIDSKESGYHEYESSANGTAPAIDMISKDIIICDWHYEKQKQYPSVVYFQKKGFRVMPSTWRDWKATEQFIKYAHETKTEKLAGHLFTTWVGAPDICPALLNEGDLSKAHKDGIESAAAMKDGMKLLKEMK